MENSALKDYVTEKVYDGLVAGCVPIYLGAPNVADYIPDNNSIINFDVLGTPEALKDELEILAHNDSAYLEKLAWKIQPLTKWNLGKCSLVPCCMKHHTTPVTQRLSLSPTQFSALVSDFAKEPSLKLLQYNTNGDVDDCVLCRVSKTRHVCQPLV